MYSCFIIPNETMTIQNLTLKRLWKKSAVIGEKFPEKKKNNLTRFSPHNWLVRNLQPWKVPSLCLQILGTNLKVKAKTSGLLYHLKRKGQTIHILHDSNKGYLEKYKKTFTEQAKEILDIPNPRSIVCTSRVNTELQIEKIWFDRWLTLFFGRCFRIICAGISSWDNYPIHDKWNNSKNQRPSHGFVYRCVNKLNQKRLMVHFVLFHNFSRQTNFWLPKYSPTI